MQMKGGIFVRNALARSLSDISAKRTQDSVCFTGNNILLNLF